MRYVHFLLVVASLIVCGSAHAEEPKFGYYGFRHHDPEVHAAIDALIKQTQKDCCDGTPDDNGMIRSGGECRVTATNLQMTSVYIDGRWCPISTETAVRDDILLPADVEAIACAASSEGQSQPYCPPIYCVAGKLGM